MIYCLVGNSLMYNSLLADSAGDFILIIIIVLALILGLPFALRAYERKKRNIELTQSAEMLGLKFSDTLPSSIEKTFHSNPMFTISAKKISFSNYIEGSFEEQAIRVFDFVAKRSNSITHQTVVGLISPMLELDKPLIYHDWILNIIDSWIYIYQINQKMPSEEKVVKGGAKSRRMAAENRGTQGVLTL
jgi:hypothetical protein